MAAFAFRIPDDPRGQVLADDPRELSDWQRHLGSKLHVVPPSRPQHRAERNPMSSGILPKTLGELVASALGRRIGYGITRKQLQHALNVSSGTVDNLLAGHQDPSPRVFMALLQFFDTAFANEIMAPSGLTVVKLADARAIEAAQKIIEGVAALKALGGQA